MSSKKGRRKNDELVSDITVNAFANSKGGGNKSRIKKSAITSDIGILVENDDLAWSDNVALFDEETEVIINEDEEGTKTIVYCKRSNRNRRRKHREIPIEEREGVDYPFDVWFSISEHLRPEDIGRFAGINKNTLAVTSTPIFWFNLYRKFYVKDSKLPQRLKPECMVRLYCLRQCVIRTLYFTYEPFKDRLNIGLNEGDPHDMVSRRCIMMWYRKHKNLWLFNFKLKVVNHVRYRSDVYIPNGKKDLSEILENHLANDEEECKTMQVTCENFCDVPMVMGMILSSVNYAQGILHHRLQLGFRSGIYCKALLPESVITLDSVIRIQVFDWWHPNYPHYKTPLPVSDRPDEESNNFLNLQCITE